MRPAPPASNSMISANVWSTTPSAVSNDTWVQLPNEVPSTALIAAAHQPAPQPGGRRAAQRPGLDALGAQPEGTGRAPDATRRGRGRRGGRMRGARLAVVRAGAGGQVARYLRRAPPHVRPGGGGGRAQQQPVRARGGWGI